MKLAIALLFCVGLHADFDITFSTGYAVAAIVQGSHSSDWISMGAQPGSAQDGQTITLPLLYFGADCYRTDLACLTTSPVRTPVTVTVPLSLTDGAGETLTESLSYTASDAINADLGHSLISYPGPAAFFAFADGEQWTVTETQSLNGTFHDGDFIQWGALSFAATPFTTTPEPSALAEVGLLLLLIAIAGKVRRTGKSPATIAEKLAD
jgi:hypothetical protein